MRQKMRYRLGLDMGATSIPMKRRTNAAVRHSLTPPKRYQISLCM